MCGIFTTEIEADHLGSQRLAFQRIDLEGEVSSHNPILLQLVMYFRLNCTLVIMVDMKL